ncbi:ComEA family DNA-binding protein [Edwardsiella tarda]|uniref:ComEA family DNA-binding protein n=1 Tax=Edwardsiella tarda TaxID=636 RepID=UPI00351C6333
MLTDQKENCHVFSHLIVILPAVALPAVFPPPSPGCSDHFIDHHHDARLWRTGSTAPQGERLNINQASAQALAAGMAGVGLDKAQAIVDFRQQHGAFASLEQLLQVKGIGRALLEKNRARLAL